jgi:PQQ-like domain
MKEQEIKMKLTRTVVFCAATLLVAQLATAQMMGGGHGTTGGSGGSGTSGGGMMGGGSTGGGMTGGGMGNGMTGTGFGLMGGAMGQALTVGSDGVVYTLRTTTATGSSVPAVQVVAIRPSGTVAWSASVDGGMTRVKLSGNVLLIADGGEDMGMNNGTATDDNGKSRLVGLSAASGSVQWTVDLDGFVSSLEPFSGGTYVIIVKGDFANGGMTGTTGGQNGMTRTLLAVGPDGKILWSLPLSQ